MILRNHIARVAIATLLFTFVCEASNSYDLRGIPIGRPCAEATKVEVANGATPIITNKDTKGLLIGFLFDHDGTSGHSTYECSEGVITGQSVVLIAKSETDAESLFEGQYNLLEEKYGMPCQDLRQTPYWARLVLWLKGLYDADILNTVTWRFSNNLELNLSRDSPSGYLKDWRVSVSIDGLPEIIQVNPDGTQIRIYAKSECDRI